MNEGTDGFEHKESAALGFERDNTLVAFDSAQDTFTSGSLFPDKSSWQTLTSYQDYDCLSDSGLLIMASLQLIFDAIAVKWSDYILGMHKHVVSLEEAIYSDPADDMRAAAVWDVSKQLLQAERLLKFHIMLLEDLQADLPENSFIVPMRDG